MCMYDVIRTHIIEHCAAWPIAGGVGSGEREQRKYRYANVAIYRNNDLLLLCSYSVFKSVVWSSGGKKRSCRVGLGPAARVVTADTQWCSSALRTRYYTRTVTALQEYRLLGRKPVLTQYSNKSYWLYAAAPCRTGIPYAEILSVSLQWRTWSGRRGALGASPFRSNR